MNEPRPAMISARPPETRSSVAKSWKTRTGSSELITETALVSRMRDVRAAAAARMTAGAETVNSWPVVLADAEHVEPDLVGQLDLLEQVLHPLLDGERRIGQLTERVDAEFHHSVTGSSRIRGGRGTSREAISASRPATARERERRRVGVLGRRDRCSAVRIAVTAAAPNEPPTVRITVLMPVAIPTSPCGTASTIRFALAANANVIPAPIRMPANDELPHVRVRERVDQERQRDQHGAEREHRPEADPLGQLRRDRAGRQLRQRRRHHHQPGGGDRQPEAVARALRRLRELGEDQEAREHRQADQEAGQVRRRDRRLAQHLEVDQRLVDAALGEQERADQRDAGRDAAERLRRAPAPAAGLRDAEQDRPRAPPESSAAPSQSTRVRSTGGEGGMRRCAATPRARRTG